MTRNNGTITRRQKGLLKKAGIFSEEELLNITVVELIEKVGENETDMLLKKLLLNSFEGIKDKAGFSSLSLADGHQYVINIFEANGFDENPEWFYKMSVDEFLKLEDLRLNKIPFLTYYHKYFVNEGQMIEPEYFRYYDEAADRYTFYINPEAVR